MRYLLSFIILLICSNSFSQNIFKGNVKDAALEEALPYVNIGIVGKNIGTVSDENGNFEIILAEKYNADSLRFSMIGYKPQSYKVADFKNLILQNPAIYLATDVSEMEEVVVFGNKNLKEKVLGNQTTSQMVAVGFSSNELGNEIGIKIKIKKSPTYIKDFNVSIARNKYDTVKFRLNFYTLKDGLPHQSVLKENIVITSAIKEGLLTVDLREYNIIVEEDFFVSLEWIEDLGEDDNLYFSAGFLGSPIIIRHTSQGDWGKLGLVSIGFNVTAAY